jgi:hypothetical protein
VLRRPTAWRRGRARPTDRSRLCDRHRYRKRRAFRHCSAQACKAVSARGRDDAHSRFSPRLEWKPNPFCLEHRRRWIGPVRRCATVAWSRPGTQSTENRVAFRAPTVSLSPVRQMPLKRGIGRPRLENDAVLFPMEDVRTREPVACTISTAALSRWFGDERDYPGHVVAFLLFREEIEEAASHKYALGANPPRLD